MVSNDNPQSEEEPCPLKRGDAEFAKALEMPETGACYQQLDRAAAHFAEADAAKPGNLAIHLRRVSTAFLSSGKSKERIESARASAAELAALANACDSPDAFHARAVAATVAGDFDAAWSDYVALAEMAETNFLSKARHLARQMARIAGLAMDHFDGAFAPSNGFPRFLPSVFSVQSVVPISEFGFADFTDPRQYCR